MLNNRNAKVVVALSLLAAPHAYADQHGGSVPATSHQMGVLEDAPQTQAVAPDPDASHGASQVPASPHQQDVLEERRSAEGMPASQHQKAVIDGKVKDGVSGAGHTGVTLSPHQKMVTEEQPVAPPGSMGEKAGIVDTQRTPPRPEPGGEHTAPSMSEMADQAPQSGDGGEAVRDARSDSLGSRAGAVKQN